MAPLAPKRASTCGSATSGSDLSSDSVASSLVSLSSVASSLRLSTIAEHNCSQVHAAEPTSLRIDMASSCSSVRDSAQRTESASWRSVSSSLVDEYLASLGDWQIPSATAATSPSSAAGSIASTLVVGPAVLGPVVARPLRRSTLSPCDPAGLSVPTPAGAYAPRRSRPCPAASMPIPVPHSRSTVKTAKPQPFLDLAPPREGRDASGRRDPSQNKMLQAVQAYYDKERRARAMRPSQQPQQPLLRVVGFEL
ncbi:hypothetical protein HYH03_000104 [Edaphochlamys debaryana]|uniref:Uncharacterized protein n=1 Tax=Edaphochlamys debaryana TaxID=47281 RepID=A0A835YGZ5_9CHLO|nr:hypothetical protein HYH03_000104 [Edaphochlamys debaryana]|eukprot:KAG2501599.1 hypothetical protein HYH03_000104 [Edaphochlamys debaryana]